MASRTLQLVLQYDGAGFSGWQLQPAARTVQGVLEDALFQLTRSQIRVQGSGRTDAGVHALAQSARVDVPERWTPPDLVRAMNAVLPRDVRVVEAHEMRSAFDARRNATARRYSYWVGMDADAASPFRAAREWHVPVALDRERLDALADECRGESCFRTFAVKGTAPESDDHRSIVLFGGWADRPGGLVFTIEANRFLHHMVRFLVGTMVEIAGGRRGESLRELLAAEDNSLASPPAPAHALYLERVTYPPQLYA